MCDDFYRYQKQTKVHFKAGFTFILLALILQTIRFIFDINLQDFYIAELLFGDIHVFTIFSLIVGGVFFWIGQQFSKYHILLNKALKTLDDKQTSIILIEMDENPWIKQITIGIMIIIIFLFSLVSHLYPVFVESSSLFDFIETVGQEFGYILPLMYIIFSFYGFFRFATGLKKRRAFFEKINLILKPNLQENV